MYALKISRDCYKVVVNLYCMQSNAHKGVLIGYGNKEHILYKCETILKNIENTFPSQPYIEEYNCMNYGCECNYVTHFKI
jgi:methyl coenzyme M reductase subunit C